MAEIRAAIVGVGNSASALIQGVHYYKDTKPDEYVPGLLHVNFGGYHAKKLTILFNNHSPNAFV